MAEAPSLIRGKWRNAPADLPLPPTPVCGGWLLVPLPRTQATKDLLKKDKFMCQTMKIQHFHSSTRKRPNLPPTTPPPGFDWPAPDALTGLCALPLSPLGTSLFSSDPSKIPAGTTLIKETPPPPTPPTHHTNTFCDLFSGIGGFRLSLQASNWLKCSLSCELSSEARLTYSKNFPESISLPSDVTRLPGSVVAAIAPTIIAGGFPCQSFSQLGKREGFDNAQTGALFMHVIRLLEAARPPVVLLENVRGLLNHDGGQTMSVVVRSLENLGYHVHVDLLDASSILPQIRNRVIIVGFLSSAASERYEFPKLPSLSRSLRSELELAPPEGGFVRLNDAQWGKVSSSSYFKENPGNRLADLDGPAGTLCSLYKTAYSLNSQFVPMEGGNPRFLTIRECCRLQGFPESFVLPETFDDRNGFYRQIGNAVPVPVIAMVALEIEAALCPDREVGDEVVLKILRDAARDPDAVERLWAKAREERDAKKPRL